MLVGEVVGQEDTHMCSVIASPLQAKPCHPLLFIEILCLCCVCGHVCACMDAHVSLYVCVCMHVCVCVTTVHDKF